MKKMTSVVVFGLTLALVSSLAAPVQAFPDFFKVFETTYVGDKSNDTQKTLAAAVEEAKKCNVCHDPRKIDGKVSKKNKNPYGEALSKLINKDDKKNIEKIEQALAEVAKMKAPESDETFGDRLTAGKLPFVTPAE